MEPKQNNDWFLLATIWIAFVVVVKLIEHQRAYGNLEMKFRFDLLVVFPALVLFTIFMVLKRWNDKEGE